MCIFVPRHRAARITQYWEAPSQPRKKFQSMSHHYASLQLNPTWKFVRNPRITTRSGEFAGRFYRFVPWESPQNLLPQSRRQRGERRAVRRKVYIGSWLLTSVIPKGLPGKTVVRRKREPLSL
jgi:hypothetical protein